jgi:hypothetical protein
VVAKGGAGARRPALSTAAAAWEFELAAAWSETYTMLHEPPDTAFFTEAHSNAFA